MATMRGDKKTERKKTMRSILSIALAGLIAATAIAPVSAATRHKRTPAPVQGSEYVDDGLVHAPVAARSGTPGTPGIIYQQPAACFTDEGYGRYASCDQAGY